MGNSCSRIFLFGWGGGDEQQVVTVRSCVGKKKYCNFVVNVVLRTLRVCS